MEAFGGECAYCHSPATGYDHIVAVSKGGMTEPANIVPCCTTCNSSKRDRDVWHWLEVTGRTPKDAFFGQIELAEVSPYGARGNVAG